MHGTGRPYIEVYVNNPEDHYYMSIIYMDEYIVYNEISEKHGVNNWMTDWDGVQLKN